MSSSKTPTPLRWTALALGLLSFASATVASARTLADGVVFDARNNSVYFAQPGGKMGSLDTIGGVVQWTTDVAAKPIALVGDKLVAQTADARLTLVVLDARSGQLERTIPVELPADVRAQTADTPRRAFRLDAEVAGDRLLTLRWSSHELSRPLRYPAELGAAVAKRSSTGARSQAGAFQLDLGGGRALPAPRSLALRAASAQAVAEAAAFLADGPRRLPAVDGLHTVVSERHTGNDGRRQFRWTVLDAAGAVVGGVETGFGAAPFVVRGNTIYFVAPAGAERGNGEVKARPHTLQALNLTTGVEQWSQELLDTRYRGPLPK
jgi:hypothetical protein